MPEVVGTMGGSASCSWPIMLEVWVKPVGFRAVQADKHLHIRRFTGRLARHTPKRARQSNQEERQDKEPVHDHDSVALPDVS